MRTLDPATEAGAHALERLDTELMGWLTTVNPDGQPQSSPIWFLWRDAEIVVYSHIRAPRNANIEANPHVSFNLNTDLGGDDVLTMEGEARIELGLPPCSEDAAFQARYRAKIDGYGWTTEWHAATYPVAIVVRPTRWRLLSFTSGSIGRPSQTAPETFVTDAPTSDPNDVAPAVADLDTIVSLSKRRGFIFPSSEIYGGINAVWDYGPLGVELKNNVKRAWWRAMVQERDDIVGLDAGILMHPQVWVTSGHVGSFSDPLVECQTDHRRFRLDELPGAEHLSATDLQDPTIVERLGLKCPVDGGPLSAPRRFNLMFKTFMGPVEEDASVIYLRPETAQGSYVNFKNVQQSSRKKLPFGIAQIGKSFRNEISPGNFVFRMREFEQMEMQYFVRPEADAAAAFEEWLPRRRSWYERYGVTPSRLRLREHAPDELAHYAKKAIDVEYRFPFGWKELEGVHNRGDFDLSRHSEASGESLEYFDQATNEHVIPWVVETAAGADRAAFTFLIDAYREEEVRGETRVSLALHPDLAPYKVAVLPLLKKRPEIVELCHRIKADLQRHTMAVYDDTAAIGKLYRRQDEIGTPWCVTVDVDSLEDGAVTVRDRDSMTQERVPVEGVTRLILDRLDAARNG